MSDIRTEITRVGRIMFERRLVDIAGGNISQRDGDRLYITPTGAGQKYLWDLAPDQILSAPVATDDLLQHPQHSKESISHLLVYRAYPQVQAIIHSHPFHVMPFCALVKPIPALIKSAQIYADSFGFIAELPMYSRQQGEDIVARLEPHAEIMGRMAAALLMPQHGIFIAAAGLYKALDCLERMDTNAYCVLAQSWIQ
jgi:L-fuculose-phosphate aldolase